MRIPIVCHYFPPEIGAPQARLSCLVSDGAEAGDQVTVLTGMPNHPTGVVPSEDKRRIRAEEQVDGYRVIRTWLYATPVERIIRKTLGHLSSVVLSGVLGARRTGRADVAVGSTQSLFSILSGMFHRPVSSGPEPDALQRYRLTRNRRSKRRFDGPIT